MASYHLRILEAATRELTALDRPVGARIVKRLQWLAENMDEVKPQPLTGSLVGLYKFRTGDYRVIYEILREEQTILIHAVGHRREIYRPR
jgi:mRNA interferase RelE/StbE